MIFRSVQEIKGSDREVVTPNWKSRRLLIEKDGMGFSLHETVVQAGTETPMCYRGHLEAVYCIEGEGQVETVPEGKVFPVFPGSMYALNNHDDHVLRAKTDLRLVCVFNPPCSGDEDFQEALAQPGEETAS